MRLQGKLKPRTSYIMSFWVKGDVSDKNDNVMLDVWMIRGGLEQHTAKAIFAGPFNENSSTWKLFKKEFTTDELTTAGNFRLSWNMRIKGRGIFVDDIVVAEKKTEPTATPFTGVMETEEKANPSLKIKEKSPGDKGDIVAAKVEKASSLVTPDYRKTDIKTITRMIKEDPETPYNDLHWTIFLKTIQENGLRTWNDWRKQNPGVIPDLSSAPISGYRVMEFNNANAMLAGINFRGVKLSYAAIHGGRLQNADMREAYLSNATKCAVKC